MRALVVVPSVIGITSVGEPAWADVPANPAPRHNVKQVVNVDEHSSRVDFYELQTGVEDPVIAPTTQEMSVSSTPIEQPSSDAVDCMRFSLGDMCLLAHDQLLDSQFVLQFSEIQEQLRSLGLRTGENLLFEIFRLLHDSQRPLAEADIATIMASRDNCFDWPQSFPRTLKGGAVCFSKGFTVVDGTAKLSQELASMVSALDGVMTSGESPFFDDLLAKRMLSNLRNLQRISSVKTAERAEIDAVMARIGETGVVKKFVDGLKTIERISQDFTSLLITSSSLRNDLGLISREISKFEANLSTFGGTAEGLTHYRETASNLANLIQDFLVQTRTEMESVLQWLKKPTVYLGTLCFAIHDMVTGFPVAPTEQAVLDDLKMKKHWNSLHPLHVAIAELKKAAELGRASRNECAVWPEREIDRNKFKIGFDFNTVPSFEQLTDIARTENDKFKELTTSLTSMDEKQAVQILDQIQRTMDMASSYHEYRSNTLEPEADEVEDEFLVVNEKLTEQIKLLKDRVFPGMRVIKEFEALARELINTIKTHQDGLNIQLQSQGLGALGAPKFYKKILDEQIEPQLANLNALYDTKVRPSVADDVAKILTRKAEDADALLQEVRINFAAIKAVVESKLDNGRGKRKTG